MKGIILAGGRGERLFPITRAYSKQLLPVYDKPMVFYPLCTLLEAGAREILVITRPDETDKFRTLLGDGAQWGIAISYAAQTEPRGIAEAPLIGESFIGGDRFALALGDNIFCGEAFAAAAMRAAAVSDGAAILVHAQDHPERYGVLEFDAAGTARAIIEKPATPPSRFAVTGLYFYDGEAVEIARALAPSSRGEIEITDLNNAYLAAGRLTIESLPDSVHWLDMGTPDGLLEAASLVADEQRRQGARIAVPEEVTWRLGHIDDAQLEWLAAQYDNDYGRYLAGLLRRP